MGASQASCASGSRAATAQSIASGPQAKTSWLRGSTSVTNVGSRTTSALGTSAAACAWRAVRNPSSAGGHPSRPERYGNGATPIPPPTRSGRSTLRQKPLPSGPSTASRSPRSAAARARVPGPTGSMRKASSPGGARQRLIGRGRMWPGGESMKNWPGRPGSSAPRATRSSRYGPSGSLATSGRSSLRNALLQGEGLLGARARDRLDRGRGARERRDARDARDERRFSDEVAVRAGAAAGGRVDDQYASASRTTPHEVDDARLAPLLANLADAADGEAGGGQSPRRACGRAELEAEDGEIGPDPDDALLVGIAP